MAVKRQDILSLLITFSVGLFAGGYLYITGFVPQFSQMLGTTQDSYETFTITSEVYGRCRLDGVCGSFQLLADRSYRYRTFARSRAEQEVLEGALSRSSMRALRRAASSAALEAQSARVLPDASCASSGNEGNDYRFWITVAGTEYLLDTCGTAMDRQSALWRELMDLWQYFYDQQSAQ